MAVTIQDFTEIIKTPADLSREQAREAMVLLLSGSVPDEDIAAFLVALRDKGEKGSELIGFAEVMRTHAAETLRAAGVDLSAVSLDEHLLDTCGTGGDGKGTFNVSTAAAFVAAAAGVRVAKHGNRSISSRCGSADVLEALGVSLNLPLARIPECLAEVGLVFLLAPQVHLAMKHVMNARRSLKTKTVFNLLGPLTNPLRATIQLVGVFDAARTAMMAEALHAVGTKRAYVVAGSDGIDEITTTGATRISISSDSGVETRDLHPDDFGLPTTSIESLQGGDSASNAQILLRVLDGTRGAHRDVVLANVAAALHLAAMVPDFRAGVERAAEAIDSGAALQKLAELEKFTRKYK